MSNASQQLFTDHVLPLVQDQARYHFRGLRHRADDYEEALAETAAHAWVGFAAAAAQGKRPELFPHTIAAFAIARTRTGRKVGKCKGHTSKDVFIAAARGKVGLSSILTDMIGNRAAILDQVAIRIDFPAWMETLEPRDQELTIHLAAGRSAKSAAKRFGVSPGRVTQLRQQLADSWQSFIA